MQRCGRVSMALCELWLEYQGQTKGAAVSGKTVVPFQRPEAPAVETGPVAPEQIRGSAVQ